MPIEAIHSPTPCLLFFALLWREKEQEEEQQDPFQLFKIECQKKWPGPQTEFNVTYFPMADHYRAEMGAPLKRAMMVLTTPRHRSAMMEAKHWAMTKESEWATAGKRSINIDPGILCLDQLVLMTTKPFAHRIYLGDNLYAELVYTYANKQFRPLEWAYPDYKSPQLIDFFQQMRHNLLPSARSNGA